MRKITLSIPVNRLLATLPEGVTGIMIGNEYIPFSQFAKIGGKTIWLKDAGVHLLVRYECAPGEPYRYIGYCEYESGEKKEFIDPTTQAIARVTCEKCRDRVKGKAV